MTPKELQQEPAVQGLMRVARNACDRIGELEQALGMAVEALEQVYLNTYDDSAEKVARDAADAARQTLGGAA